MLPMADDQIINGFELVAPATMLRLARLNLFIRLVNCTNNILKVVVCAARKSQFSWIRAVEADFSWVCEVDRVAGTSLLCGVKSLQAWIMLIQADDRKCRRDIKSLCTHSKANRIEDKGITLPSVTLEQIFECEICAKPCPFTQQLASHRWTQHGLGTDARLFIGELNDCPICLRRFSTRQQAVTHLSKDAKICRSSFMQDAEILPLDYVEQCEITATKLRLEAKSSGVRSTAHPPTIRGPLQKQHVAAFC